MAVFYVVMNEPNNNNNKSLPYALKYCHVLISLLIFYFYDANITRILRHAVLSKISTIPYQELFLFHSGF